jgi:hypothetical protein
MAVGHPGGGPSRLSGEHLRVAGEARAVTRLAQETWHRFSGDTHRGSHTRSHQDDLDPGGRPVPDAHAEFGISVFRMATRAVPVVRGSRCARCSLLSQRCPAHLIRRMADWYRLPGALRRADVLKRAAPPAVSMDRPAAQLTYASAECGVRVNSAGQA